MRSLLAVCSVLLGLSIGVPLAGAIPSPPADRGSDLRIEAVLQKAFGDVDERGTEAAAATAVMVGKKSKRGDGLPRAVFHADHPFAYVVRDMETGAVLFIGRVVAPDPDEAHP